MVKAFAFSPLPSRDSLIIHKEKTKEIATVKKVGNVRKLQKDMKFSVGCSVSFSIFIRHGVVSVDKKDNQSKSN